MVTENPVYLKLEYDESLESKKDVLYSEISLLNLLKVMKKYNEKRFEELKIKSKVYKNIKELNLAIKKMKSSFPSVKVHDIEKKEELKKELDFTKEKEGFDYDLTSQLEEIQDKLNSLNRQ